MFVADSQKYYTLAWRLKQDFMNSTHLIWILSSGFFICAMSPFVHRAREKYSTNNISVYFLVYLFGVKYLVYLFGVFNTKISAQQNFF